MPRLLDLFCGQGGAAAGYIAAGWDVTGVDLAKGMQESIPPAYAEFIGRQLLNHVGGAA